MSLRLDYLRDNEEYAGKTDSEIAKTLAEKEGYVIVLQFEDMGENLATCSTVAEVNEVLANYRDAKILYDIRGQVLEITPKLLLQSKCSLCSRSATQQSLYIGGGNDFYFCPTCAKMFCQSCYPSLPLTGYPSGYAKCPGCDVKLQRAFPGVYGNKPFRSKNTESQSPQGMHGWIRQGKTLMEAAKEKQAQMEAQFGRNVEFQAYGTYYELIQKNEAGVFSMYAIDEKAYIIAKVVAPPSHIADLFKSQIQSGNVIFVSSCHTYPTYPMTYLRIFVPLEAGPQSGTAKGTIIESPTDFTNANFQEWVRVLEETKKTAFLVYDENGNTLAEGKIDMEEGIINEIVHIVDQANITLISIPKEQRDFHSTSQAFFKDHPQPFVDVAAKTVVQQQPSQPKSSQPGSTSVPVSSIKKSPLLAAVLSFFLFGGIGQVYLGQWKKGFTLIVANFLMNSFLILFMPISIPIVSVLGVGDAYGTAQEMEKGSSSGEWKFNINWKAAGAALLIYGLREIIFLIIRKSSG